MASEPDTNGNGQIIDREENSNGRSSDNSRTGLSFNDNGQNDSAEVNMLGNPINIGLVDDEQMNIESEDECGIHSDDDHFAVQEIDNRVDSANHTEADDLNGYGSESDQDPDIEVAALWDRIDEANLVIQDTDNDDDEDGDHDDGGGGVEHEEDYHLDLRTELRTWVNDEQVKHCAVDKLLKILRRHGQHNLPQVARTLVQTPRHLNVENRSGMKYVYFGLEQIKDQLHKYENVMRLLEVSIFRLPLMDSLSTNRPLLNFG